MRAIIHYIDHLFWCLGHAFLAFFRLDYEKFSEAISFTYIHLMYRSRLISRVELPRKNRIRNRAISFFGLLMTLILVAIIYLIIKTICYV